MSGRDLAASVGQPLLNRSRLENRPFQELLQYFAMERYLYRLSQSRFADRFVLKGSLLLTAWRAPMSRPTIDIDLAGRTSNELDHIRALLVEICSAQTAPDGIDFVADSVRVARIREDADYEGVRGQFHATLAKARVPMRVDIGFGDVITPEPGEVDYPTLLDFPAPVMKGYPRETVVAEKLEALAKLGILNSRLKDYYDIALLARIYPFGGRDLARAIATTFRHRGTAIAPEPVGLSDAFASDPARQAQWRSFLRRNRFPEQTGGLPALVSEVARFVLAPLDAAARGESFEAEWAPEGPWT